MMPLAARFVDGPDGVAYSVNNIWYSLEAPAVLRFLHFGYQIKIADADVR